MATVDDVGAPRALEAAPGAVVERPLGVFTRPETSGRWTDWLFTVDHKKIGILYGATALFFLVVGGTEALFIRWQLAQPGQKILSAETYNQVFTTHGVTMVFLVVMPLGAAFANYLLPLQIGARDVAFPRLNAFSYWLFLAGGIFLTSSIFIGGWWENAPDAGWFGYAPNSGLMYSPSKGVDFYALGLQILGIASLISAVNLIVTVLNMRAPGMTLMKMPIFVWMTLVTQFLLLFSVPVISLALFLLTFDRLFGANFFNVEAGADPLLWQHLFWIFGHPEVYIMVLPAFGIVSEVIPVFSRKPLFGYKPMVFSGIAIGFLGFGVWAHHMFTAGIGPVSVAAFGLATMFVAVPTGVKIVNWMGTMWGGRVRFTVPMLFAMGLVTMFVIGGLSGVTHAIAPADTQQTDTYYIVAHFHYVLFGGSLLGYFGGLYFWWPKAFGYKLGEGWGKVSFWLLMAGMNLTFGPMHIVGLQGMSRRVPTYKATEKFATWNLVASLGAVVLAFGILATFYNMWISRRRAATLPPVGPDPWDGRSLEWMTASPTPEHNFDRIPRVRFQDEFWHRKWAANEEGRIVRIADVAEVTQDGSAPNVHLPAPSYWPIVIAAGFPLVGYGLIYTYWLVAFGALVILAGAYGWVFEPSDAEVHEAPHINPDDHADVPEKLAEGAVGDSD